MYIGNGVRDLQDAVRELYETAEVATTSSESGGIRTGQVTGDFVSDAAGSYAYTMAVDVPVSDGDYVLFEVSNNIAVIIGKP